jgi:hypothetical protein
MTKFVLKSILIITPVILVILLMELLFQNIPNDYKYKKEYLDSNSNQIETLILGSSHSYNGIDPIYFSKNTFNTAYSAQHTYFDFEILKKYQDNFKKLKCVILSVTPVQLYTKRIKEISVRTNTLKYNIYYDITTNNSIYNHSECLNKIFQLHRILNPIIKYYARGETQFTCSELGWNAKLNTVKPPIDLDAHGLYRAESHTSFAVNKDLEFEIVEYNAKILTSIVEWCKVKNIKLLLFTPPAHESYRRNFDQVRATKAINRFRKIASTYEKCNYENMFDNSEFTNDDYYDADHVSKKGAIKLSKIINNINLEIE